MAIGRITGDPEVIKMGIVRISSGKFPPAIGWSLLARQSGVTACAVRTSQPRFKGNIHGSPSIVRIRLRYWSSTASCFEIPLLCERLADAQELVARHMGSTRGRRSNQEQMP